MVMAESISRSGDPSSCQKHHALGASISGASNVTADSCPVLRVGDPGRYAGACENAATPWRAIEGRTTVKINGKEVATAGLSTAHPHAPGRLLRGSATVRVGGPSANMFARAKADAIHMLDAAEASLLRWNDADRANFRRWFGDDSEAARQEMLRKIRQTRDKVAGADFAIGTFEEDWAAEHKEARKPPYAYVHKEDDSTIYLDERFWDAKRDGDDRQGGVVVHEATHFASGADTEDQLNHFDDKKAYGQARREVLANEDPGRARANGDSVEYFVENVP